MTGIEGNNAQYKLKKEDLFLLSLSENYEEFVNVKSKEMIYIPLDRTFIGMTREEREKILQRSKNGKDQKKS